MHITICIFVLWIHFPNQVFSVKLVKKDKEVFCSDVPTSELSKILGTAYNSRYMSINQPTAKELSLRGTENHKRDAEFFSDFYVEESYEKEVDEQSIWTRSKRNAMGFRQWDCESVIKWHDLGPDYFPRYLRSVECKSQSCWYNLFKCKPKSFTVKFLRRKVDLCVVVEKGRNIGTVGLPSELRDMWVWEERALTFCCDCVAFDFTTNNN